MQSVVARVTHADVQCILMRYRACLVKKPKYQYSNTAGLPHHISTVRPKPRVIANNNKKSSLSLTIFGIQFRFWMLAIGELESRTGKRRNSKKSRTKYVPSQPGSTYNPTSYGSSGEE